MYVVLHRCNVSLHWFCTLFCTQLLHCYALFKNSFALFYIALCQFCTVYHDFMPVLHSFTGVYTILVLVYTGYAPVLDLFFSFT